MSLIFSTERCEKALKKTELKKFKKIIRHAVKIINPDLSGKISLSFAKKNQIRKIKKDFWGINRESDVVTFSYNEPMNEISADIIICPQVARERSPEFGTNYFYELILYAVHGLLHLSGFDDMKERERLKMKREEKKIMKILDDKFKIQKQQKINKK